MKKARSFLLAAALATAVQSVPASAEAAQVFRGDYSVTLWGLVIGRSTFTSTISGDRVSMEGTLASAGLARVFDRTRGAVSASGRVAGDTVAPSSYSMNYTTGRRSRAAEIAFSRGAVSSTRLEPEPTKRRETWIDLDKGDLARVADPLTSTLVKASNPEAVCQRTLRVYDGEMRMDLRLSPAGRERIAIPGFEGDAVACSASFAPRSGYRSDDRSIRYLRDRSDIRIAFAPLGSTGIYAPVRLSFDIEVGTVTVRADRLESN